MVDGEVNIFCFMGLSSISVSINQLSYADIELPENKRNMKTVVHACTVGKTGSQG